LSQKGSRPIITANLVTYDHSNSYIALIAQFSSTLRCAYLHGIVLRMVIFINGSVNAGKSTTSKLLAEKLDAEWVDVDEIAHEIPDFDLNKDISKAIELAIKTINKLTAEGKNVVANYVLRQKDYDMLHAGLHDKQQFYFTLAPRLDVVQKDRGRGLNDWEYKRIKYHYDTGIANPNFGTVIDTSDLSIEETVQMIVNQLSSST
jgi:hypothetical protein